jgi:hypothetical protein
VQHVVVEKLKNKKKNHIVYRVRAVGWLSYERPRV